MDRSDLNLAYARADEENDDRRLEELRRAERRNEIDELEPKYLDSEDSDPSTSSSSTGTSGDLEEQIEQAAQLNELAGAEETADALRRMKDAEDPQKALQKARRRADSVGDEYARGEFDELLDE